MNIQYDRANFPMIWMESIKAYIHWLPVTKIQFEYYLWDSPNSNLGQAWLDRVYRLNPRVTPKKVSKTNYWQSFVTGVAPIEANYYADWCAKQSEDTQYSLPTAAEWQMVYKEAARLPILDQLQELQDRLTERCKTLLSRVNGAIPAPRNLADQMLFVSGVMEWVDSTQLTGAKSEWAAHGSPIPLFRARGRWLDTPLFPTSIPRVPSDDTGREETCGFRLVRRGSA